MVQGGIGWRFFKRKTLERVTSDFIASLNAHDFSKSRKFLTDDFTVADLTGIEIRGADDYIAAEKVYRSIPEKPVTRIKSINFDQGDALMRAQELCDQHNIAGPTMWRVIFKDRHIRRIEMTRTPDKLTVVDFREKPEPTGA